MRLRHQPSLGRCKESNEERRLKNECIKHTFFIHISCLFSKIFTSLGGVSTLFQT